MPIRVTDSIQPGCKGGCIFAAAASGQFENVYAAADALADKCETVYVPDMQRHEQYVALYEHYRRLATYFAEGENPVMKYLRTI